MHEEEMEATSTYVNFEDTVEEEEYQSDGYDVHDIEEEDF